MGLRKMAMTVVLGALMLALTAGVAVAVDGNSVHCEYPSQNPLTPECYGTPERDIMKGRDDVDIIYARGGDDVAFARSGADEAYGGAGRDGLLGDDGNDKLFGGDNPDTLDDRRPNDADVLRGGGGNDTILAYDSDFTDTIICGAGDNDTVYFDWDIIAGEIDTVDASCENTVANDEPDQPGG